MKQQIIYLLLMMISTTAVQSQTVGNAGSATGTYIIDLRPTPSSEPYLKEFRITKVNGKKFNGEFYGYPFTGGLFNLDWEKIYFAFTTQDQSGIYYHSGYVEGNKVFGITLNEARGFVLPWKGERKKE